MELIKGKYKDNKIYIKGKHKLKENSDINVYVVEQYNLKKFFGLFKDRYNGNSVDYINKIRKPRV